MVDAVRTVSLSETGPYLMPISSSSYDPGNLSTRYRGLRFEATFTKLMNHREFRATADER